MFYSYRKLKKPSNKGAYILVFFILIILVWGILAYVGLNVETKIVTKEINFSNNVDVIK